MCAGCVRGMCEARERGAKGVRRGAQLELPRVEAGGHVQVLQEEAVQVLVQPPQLRLRLAPAGRPRAAATAAAAAAAAAETPKLILTFSPASSPLPAE